MFYNYSFPGFFFNKVFKLTFLQSVIKLQSKAVHENVDPDFLIQYRVVHSQKLITDSCVQPTEKIHAITDNGTVSDAVFHLHLCRHCILSANSAVFLCSFHPYI